jgi:hypothetical protein
MFRRQTAVEAEVTHVPLTTPRPLGHRVPGIMLVVRPVEAPENISEAVSRVDLLGNHTMNRGTLVHMENRDQVGMHASLLDRVYSARILMKRSP